MENNLKTTTKTKKIMKTKTKLKLKIFLKRKLKLKNKSKRTSHRCNVPVFRMSRWFPRRFRAWSCSCKRRWVSVECLRWGSVSWQMTFNESRPREMRWQLLMMFERLRCWTKSGRSMEKEAWSPARLGEVSFKILASHNDWQRIDKQ